MLWISVLFMAFTVSAQELPRFLTKHASDTLRFISMDGRYAYIQKKPGVLGFVSSFRSIDFLNESQQNDFIVKSSNYKNRILIESVPNTHTEMSLVKKHRLYVVDYGNSSPREIGMGRGAKLHLRDEWVTFYDPIEKIIHIQNLLTKKDYKIKVSKKANPFFIPEVEMIHADRIYYTDVNESGYSALVSYQLSTQKSTIVYKSSQSATRLELCQSGDYLGMGEFPYDGVVRGSQIQYATISSLLASGGFNSVYNSVEQDIGNMVCLPDSIYFVKTMNHDRTVNFKVTEAVKLTLKDQKIEAKSNLKFVTQLLKMDGRILVPIRGEFFVLEGTANLGEDILKSAPTREELQIDL
ncbi:MAG: hypothetical protein NDI69_08400 [Bacteriovoracaceae bacterium]|nr:hypothetical protein [Bacteriovoracaceae bacterium]